MLLTTRRFILASLTLALALVLTAGPAQAQLSPALWGENISLDASSDMTSFMGADMFAPESHTEELSGATYDVSGSIQFGTTLAPQGTAEVTWNVFNDVTSLNLTSILNIDFQCRVIETATPPVTVTEVPVHVLATGSGVVEAQFGSRATAQFVFRAIGTSVVLSDNLDVSGNPDSPEPLSDAFTVDENAMIPPDVVCLVGMTATASMGSVGVPVGAVGTATGFIDPVIEVVDEIIPGTSDSYRDYYVIEFSEGYGAQTPVESTTFGRIKRQFQEPR